MKHKHQTQYQIQETKDNKQTLLVVENVKVPAVVIAPADKINHTFLSSGKFGSVPQYTVYDVELGMERFVNASALSYLDAVEEKLGQKPSGTDVKLRIKKNWQWF
jgi:hypothetical protein